MKVFLGGTCNDSKWREELIPMLEKEGIEYFNPVVDDWNEEAQVSERRERKECDYVLYVITPAMTGVYAIAEAVDDSNKRPSKTIFCSLAKYNGEEFSESAYKSLIQVKYMIARNGCWALSSLKDVIFALVQEKESRKLKEVASMINANARRVR